jgi:hypothetical protein
MHEAELERAGFGEEVKTMTTSNTKPNQTVSVVRDTKAIAGVDKYLGNAQSVQLQGQSYATSAIKSALQGEIDGVQALDLAKAAVKQQAANTRTVRATARSMRAALRQYILSAYGRAATQVFDDFGIPVPKPSGPKSVKSKAQAAEKATATKEAKKAALEKLPPAGSAAQQQSTTPQK